MARIRVEELYRGEGAGAKYGSGGIMGEVTKELLTSGVPEGYDEQIWIEMLIVKHTPTASGKCIRSTLKPARNAKSCWSR